MSWVYMYIGKGTCDGSVFIKRVLCTNMYRNIHVIIANDRRIVVELREFEPLTSCLQSIVRKFTNFPPNLPFPTAP